MTNAGSATIVEARATAKGAYTYGFWPVGNCRIIYSCFGDRKSKKFKAPWNQVANIPRVFTPEDKAVPSPNSDTPYSLSGFDLRAENVKKVQAGFLREAAPAASSIRVMVVEDIQSFRRFVCSKLERKSELRIICEVSDGLEAVQKAAELKPDLILLDIGLPTLNGIEAARRILVLVPESKIIFSTQETSPEIVQEAMRLGAWGYVFKTHAEGDLLLAIDAVLSGKRFVSCA